MATAQNTSISTVDFITRTFHQTAPKGLDHLSYNLEDIPRCGQFDLDDLNRVVDKQAFDDKDIENFELGSGNYLADLMQRLRWWGDVGQAWMYGRGSESPDPEMESAGKEMLALRDAVYRSLAAAEATTMHFTSDCDPGPNLILLTHYRRYIRYVVDLGKRLWPQVDLRWLEEQA